MKIIQIAPFLSNEGTDEIYALTDCGNILYGYWSLSGDGVHWRSDISPKEMREQEIPGLKDHLTMRTGQKDYE